jgi:hypothetical protein
MTAYNRCVCQVCGSHFATVLEKDDDLQSEPCPKCGAKQLKLAAEAPAAAVRTGPVLKIKKASPLAGRLFFRKGGGIAQFLHRPLMIYQQ